MIFIITTYFIIKEYFSYKENEENNNKLIESAIKVNPNTQEAIIDWKYLKSINKDIIGWIEIEGTKINYPILQDNSNLFYLKHSYNKKYNPNGSIFTTNKNFLTDKENIIYGHNMKNKSMFSMLAQYYNKDFLFSHLNIKIYTPTTNYNGVIFSVYSIDVETETNNIKQLDFNEKIKYYKKSSKYVLNTTKNPSKIVKLTTCSYINVKARTTNKRYYIIADIVPMR